MAVTIALVQQATNFVIANGATTLTVTLSSVPSSGNALICAAGFLSSGGANNLSSIAGGGGQAWQKAVISEDSGQFVTGEVWYSLNIGTGTQTVTLTMANAINSANSDMEYANVAEWAGLLTTTPTDGTGSESTAQSGGGGGLTVNSPNVTTGNANDLVVAVLSGSASAASKGPNNQFVSMTGVNQSYNFDNLEPAYRIVTATGTYTTSWDDTANQCFQMISCIAAFKAATATAIVRSAPVPQRTMTGVGI